MVAPPTDEYPTWNIDTLVAVEPSEGMREAWEKGLEKVAPGSKNAKIVDGTFDDFSKASEFGIKEGSVDLIIIAQAWHWCPDHEAAFVSANEDELTPDRSSQVPLTQWHLCLHLEPRVG